MASQHPKEKKMAKALVFIASAICTLAIANFAFAHDNLFNVEGRVYCDTCRVQFETRLSESISGAQVRLECRETEGGNVTYTVDGTTDSTGHYSLTVDGDHEDDICEVALVSSPRSDCTEATTSKAKVVCTGNSGMHTTTRLANPLAFLIDQPVSGCPDVLRELAYVPNSE